VIAFNAVLLLKPAVQELADTLPTSLLDDDIKGIAASVPQVIDVEKCVVRKMGFDYYVEMHVIVDGDLSVRRGHDIAHEVKDAIRHVHSRVADVLVHIEPS
jgi:divalent metal cation (Fe/Co/Zn/Cd) transporter